MSGRPSTGAGRARLGLSLRVKLLGLLAGTTFVALAVAVGLLVFSDIRMFRSETATTADQLAGTSWPSSASAP